MRGRGIAFCGNVGYNEFENTGEIEVAKMTSRERMQAVCDFRAPDGVGVQYLCTPVGFYEHGEKLNDLYEAHPGDFAPFERIPIPQLGPECFDSAGRYCEKRRDEWGTVWKFRIFGVWGLECSWPLDDWGKLSEYQFPPMPAWVTDEKAFEEEKARVKAHQEQYYFSGGGGSLFEKLIALRPFEDVLCDLMDDDEHIIELMDRLEAYYKPQIEALIRMGVDSISFGDDMGTQENLIFSLDVFRRHFKPRYERLMKPIRDEGIKIHFHSCGQIEKLFQEFADLGVNSVWPQLPLYNTPYYADMLRELKLAVALHTDRANTMTFGTPGDVRELVKREFEIFRPDKGGAWFYIEADNGMPFENLQALVEQVYEYR